MIFKMKNLLLCFILLGLARTSFAQETEEQIKKTITYEWLTYSKAFELKDYNKIFEESMNEFQSERENEREEEQIWSKALKRYPLGAFQKMGGTLLDRIQAKSARTFLSISMLLLCNAFMNVE
jgi:hypothetical protein